MSALYDVETVNDFVNTITENGYDLVVIPGCLIDSYICIAPDEEHYNFIFRETYLNSWSSAYTMRRCKKLPKKVMEEIENIMAA